MPLSGRILFFVVAVSPALWAGETAPADWVVRVTTSGGFTGRGRGSVEIDSGGGIRSGACEGRLTDAETQRVGAAVKEAKPEGWAASALKGAAPDAFGYALELRRGEEISRASWYDNTARELPFDLAELSAGVASAWSRVRESCGAKGKPGPPGTPK